MEYIKKATVQAPYTIIYNSVARSRKLSFESKGVLFFLLSLPPDWVTNKKWILKNLPIKRTMLDKAFKELESQGYVCSFDHSRSDGRYKGKGYLVYAESQLSKYDPLDALTDAATRLRFKCKNTEVVLPTSVKQHLQNKENTNTRNNQLTNKSINRLTRERDNDEPF